MSNVGLIQSVRAAISADRMGTFEKAAGAVGDENLASLELYLWNAHVSGAFMAPLQICEVVVRNAVAEALEATYGPRWPWERSFELSLPDPMCGFSARRDLATAHRRGKTTGKVIPELKFMFWQMMFTQRHDQRLWNTQLRRVLPNLGPGRPVSQLRQGLFEDLEQVRVLRNRIAHHEPIFTRNLANDFQRIATLIGQRCTVTASWMVANQKVTALLDSRP